MKEGCKERICTFSINNRTYNIFNVTKIAGKSTYVGQTDYDTGDVYIEKTTNDEMLITLKHELTHIWLFENGYKYQHEAMCFGVEDVCEIVAYSNNFINTIVDEYIKTLEI